LAGGRITPGTRPGSGGGPNRGDPLDPDPTPLGFPEFDGVDRPSAASPTASVAFRYGEVEFSVPAAWYTSYVTGRSWSSTQSVLDRIWPDFLGAVALSGADVATLDQNVGCYNLPRGGAGFAFWRDGYGAPHTFFMYVLQMLLVFRDHIQDKESGDACGWGREYSDFLVRLLRREVAERSGVFKSNDKLKGEEVLDFRFHFLNPDDRFYVSGDIVGSRPLGSFQYCYAWWDRGDTSWANVPYEPANPTIEAAIDVYAATFGTPFNHGIRYDAWEWTWREDVPDRPYLVGDSFFGWAADRGGLPDPYCQGGGHVTGTYDRVIFHPSWLWYDGALVDFLLYWARVALDYADHVGGSPLHEDAAFRIGRFVLRRFVRWGTHVIHEVGHVFCGGSHCDRNSCYMDHMYERFECAARARLGLYVSPLELRAGAEICHAENNHRCSNVTNCDFCGAETSVDGACDCTSYQNLLCRIDTGGAPFALGTSYSDWFFCMTPCRRARMPLADSFTGLDCYRVSSSTWTESDPGRTPTTQEWHSCVWDGTTENLRGFEFLTPDPDALTVPSRRFDDPRVRPPRVP